MSLDDLTVDITIEEIDLVLEDLPEITIDLKPPSEVIVITAQNVGPQGPQGIPGIGVLPGDTIIAANAFIIRNRLLYGDAEPAFRLMGSGRLEWGPGGQNPLDTFLYRLAANTLRTPGFIYTGLASSSKGSESEGPGTMAGAGGSFASVRANDNGWAFLASIIGDPGVWRYGVDSRGKIHWSDGINPVDTTLERVGPSHLFTSGTITVAGQVSVGSELFLTNAKAFIAADGAHQWGPGDWSRDTDLYRLYAGALRTSGELRVGGSTYIGDWNQATDNGWYYSGSVPNAPMQSVWLIGQVLKGQGGIVQRVWARDYDWVWERKYGMGGGTSWTSWTQIWPLSQTQLPANLGPTSKTVSDVNTIADTGWYRFDGATNTPPTITNNQGYIQHHSWGAGYVVQTLYTLAYDEIWTRQSLGGNWRPWVKVYPIPFTESMLPPRLSAYSQGIGDFNNATSSGFYVANAALNAPPSSYNYWMVNVTAFDPPAGHSSQMAYNLFEDTIYFRRWASGVWQAWQKVYPPPATGLTLQQQYMENAREAVTGGNPITWSGGRFNWGTRFITISKGNNPATATAGYFDINPPPVGTQILNQDGALVDTVTAAGIAIGAWSCLYYILPLGESNVSKPGNFRLVSYGAPSVIPNNWLLIAFLNGDSNELWVTPGKTFPAPAAGGTQVVTHTNQLVASPGAQAVVRVAVAQGQFENIPLVYDGTTGKWEAVSVYYSDCNLGDQNVVGWDRSGWGRRFPWMQFHNAGLKPQVRSTAQAIDISQDQNAAELRVCASADAVYRGAGIQTATGNTQVCYDGRFGINYGNWCALDTGWGDVNSYVTPSNCLVINPQIATNDSNGHPASFKGVTLMLRWTAI